MLNNLVIVGKIKVLPIENEYLDISVQRSYRNTMGDYEYDDFKVHLWDGIKENIIKYAKKDDVIVIKGRLESCEDNIKIIAERVVFIKKQI